MKGLWRYKSVSFWMIIIFAMSFVVFNYNMQAKLTEKYEYADAVENSYKYTSTVLVVPVAEFYDESKDYQQYLIDSCLEMNTDNVNITIVDLSPRIDNEGNHSLTDVYICGPIPKYALISGSYPAEDEIMELKCAVVGRNKMRYTYMEGGKRYIDIYNEPYLVTGCMSTGRSKYLDNDILIFNKEYNGRFWKFLNDDIKMGMGQLVFESDTNANLSEAVSEFQTRINEKSQGMLEGILLSGDENLKIVTSQIPEPKYRAWAWLAYVFSIITTFFMCQYCMVCRKKEFAIKKTCGFSVIHIIKQFLTEIFIAMLIGIASGMLLTLSGDMLSTGFAAFNVRVFSDYAGIILGYIGVSFLLVSVYPFVWLMRAAPIQLLNSKKGNG